MEIYDKLNRLNEKFDIFLKRFIELEEENVALQNKVAILEEKNKELTKEKESVIEKIEEILNKMP
jgi:predicted metal-dependent hydrolase